MELADGRERRTRRPNAGNLLQDLLQSGLDAAEEHILQQLDDASDSSFTCSTDEECVDAIESDFSAEEVEGTLEDAVVATDLSAWREERQARKVEKDRVAKRLQRAFTPTGRQKAVGAKTKPAVTRPKGRGGAASLQTSSAGTSAEDEEEEDLRQAVRRRPPSSIPCAARLQAALARGRTFRESQQEAEHQQQQQQHVGKDAPLPAAGMIGGGAGRRRRRHATTTTGGVVMHLSYEGQNWGSRVSDSPTCGGAGASRNEGLYGLNLPGQRVVSYSSAHRTAGRTVLTFAIMPPLFGGEAQTAVERMGKRSRVCL